MMGIVKFSQNENNQDELRTRIAPTPSGFLHAGNIFSFVITAGLARELGAEILLRIDDLDRDRYRKAYLNDIFETLHLLEINWTEGPTDPDDFLTNWSQLKRFNLYEHALEELKTSGLVFACNCSRKQIHENHSSGYPGTCIEKKIDLDDENVCWRWKPFITDQIWMNDYTNRKVHHSFPASQQHFVIRKRDGTPSYHLASVLDDNHFNINLIVRGADLFESTLVQLEVAKNLGLNKFEKTLFYHHPLITDASGQKLSKSAGAMPIRSLENVTKDKNKIFEGLSNVLLLNQIYRNWHDCYLGYKEKNNHLFP